MDEEGIEEMKIKNDEVEEIRQEAGKGSGGGRVSAGRSQ
jgi:hypothetical protein